MYIQLKDFNSYMSPKNKDWLYIFVQLFICILLQNWCNIYMTVKPHGPITDLVLSLCGVFQLLCNTSFRYDQTEKPLWTCKRCLTSRCAFVFTRSEKSVVNKKRTFLAISIERWIIALFCLTCSNANPNLKCNESQMFTIFYILRMITISTSCQ